MNIGTLTGAIAIEDQLSSKLTVLTAKVKQFAENFDGALGATAIGVGVLVSAISGAVVSIKNLAESGDKLIGIESAFDRLSEAAGSTGEILFNRLNEGVKGTVDSMELMQAVMRPLTAGVKLTGDDMEILGQASRALGKATGTDAAHGLTLLSTAMATGSTRGLRLAGVAIDLETAQKAYADSLNKSVGELTDLEKAEFRRIGTVAAATEFVNRLGVSQLTLTEKIHQTGVEFGNWVDNLRKAVASSSSVMRAFDAVGEALKKAFGGDSKVILDTVVGWINSFADAVAKYAPPIIAFIGEIKDAVVDLWHKVQAAWDLVPDWFKNIAKEAGMAAGAMYIVQKAGLAITEPTVIGGVVDRIASLATIWSGFGKGLSSSVPLIKNWVAAVALTYQLGGVGAILTEIGVGFLALAATPLGFTALLTGMLTALYQVGIAVKNLYTWWQEGKPMWDFFMQKDDDNFVLRLGRNLGLFAPKVVTATNVLQGMRSELEGIMRAGVGKGKTDGKSNDDEAVTAASNALKFYQDQLNATITAVGNLTEYQKKSIVAGLDAGKSQEEIAKRLMITQAAVKGYVQELAAMDTNTKESLKNQANSWLIWAKSVDEAGVKAMEAAKTDNITLRDINRELDDLMAAASLSRREKEIRDIELQGELRKIALKESNTLTEDAYKISADKIDQITQAKLAAFRKNEEGMSKFSFKNYEDIARDAETKLEEIKTNYEGFSPEIIAHYESIADAARKSADDFRSGFAQALGDTVGNVKNAVGEIAAAFGTLDNPLQIGGNHIYTNADFAKKFKAPTPRASGGPVTVGKPHRVGEVGPEMFVPSQSGTIVPAGGGGKSTIIINAQNSFFDNPDSMNKMGRYVEDALAKRQSGNDKFSRR